ncbi:MAG TPA: glycosyltransferase family 9 protein [Nitrospiraceae bacterium]|nr:glycosyltransferase family 9 protein [Nitrospiraceae bacterium]
MQRTLLIVHPGSLGDVLLALPAMRALRAAFSNHALGLLTQNEVGRLLMATAEVHKAFALEGASLTNILSAGMVDGEWEQWLSHCDVAVGWLADPDRSLASAFHAFGIPHILVASPHSPGHRSVHQSDRFLETITSVISKPFQDHALQLPHAVMREATSRLTSIGILSSQPLVIIHPGSGSRHKCAAPGLLATLLKKYENNVIEPLVIGGPADVNQIACLQRTYSHPFRVLQDLDLLSIAGVIAHANCFIGHDSGLTHLAACLHVSTVALFGPTDPHRWAPRGSHVKVVTGPSCHCEGETAVRGCADKPCLQIPIEQILTACPMAVRAE